MALRGEKLDKPSYEILRSLRGGHSADSYLVDHNVFGRKCVQKTYSTLGLEDAAAHREPRVLHEIQHDHVVEVLEAQYDPEISDAITLVTVYCEGECVAKAFDQGYRFGIHQALRLAMQSLDALAHLHTDHRLLHRDVKPGNLFLDADRHTAFIGDLGSAAEMNRHGHASGIEGSPLYVPPEAGPTDGWFGVSGDIYGLGMTLFELLNGPFPYAELDPVLIDRRLTRGQRALPERAFVFAPQVPEPLRTVVRKAIRAAPRERYQSCSEFITAIERTRCIDWRHVSGHDLDGRWEGTWPPRVGVSRRRYRIDSWILKGGPDRGRRRLEAYQATSATATPARFGVADVTVDANDRDAVERFFRAVETKAAQRMPIRR